MSYLTKTNSILKTVRNSWKALYTARYSCTEKGIRIRIRMRRMIIAVEQHRNSLRLFERRCKPAMLAQSREFIQEGYVPVCTAKRRPSLAGANSNKHFAPSPLTAAIGNKDRCSLGGAEDVQLVWLSEYVSQEQIYSYNKNVELFGVVVFETQVVAYVMKITNFEVLPYTSFSRLLFPPTLFCVKNISSKRILSLGRDTKFDNHKINK